MAQTPSEVTDEAQPLSAIINTPTNKHPKWQVTKDGSLTCDFAFKAGSAPMKVMIRQREPYGSIIDIYPQSNFADIGKRLASFEFGTVLVEENDSYIVPSKNGSCQSLFLYEEGGGAGTYAMWCIIFQVNGSFKCLYGEKLKKKFLATDCPGSFMGYNRAHVEKDLVIEETPCWDIHDPRIYASHGSRTLKYRFDCTGLKLIDVKKTLNPPGK